MNDRDTGEARSHGDRGNAPGGHDLSSRTAAAEWIVGIISALLVLGALGLTALDALRSPGGLPELTVRLDSISATPGGHRVNFTVRNEGAETAAAVQVFGALSSGEETVEESQATIDYVPEGAQRRGALLFRDDPQAHALDLRVTGFALP